MDIKGTVNVAVENNFLMVVWTEVGEKKNL